MNARVVELVSATNFSFLRAASHPDEMALQARAHGLAGLGVADWNSLAGVVRAHAAAKQAELPFAPGARLITREGVEMAAYPRDRAAYARLTRLLTHGKRRAPKGECDIALGDVAAHAAGHELILLPPREGADPPPAWREAVAAFLAQRPPDARVHVGLIRAFDAFDGQRLAARRALAAAWGLEAVAVGDALMHAPDRRALLDVVTCVREHVTLDEAGRRLALNAERHLKTPQEMRRVFAGHGDAVDAAARVFDRLTFSLDELAYQYPDEITTPGETPLQTLTRLTWAGARERYPGGVPQAVAGAVDRELALIEELDYAPYFLTVHDLVAEARRRNILCQGRGSAANSAVCFCLGVTAVDPTKLDLLFERFVSAERNEPPDIDVDFEHARREEIIQYIYDKYGRERAGLTATVITYRAKSAIREVGKALGLSVDVVDAVSKTVWGWSAEGVDPAHVRAEAGLDPREPRVAQAVALAKALVGFPRHLSQHVGGFVITRDRLDDIATIENAAMHNRTVICWDKDDIEALGMLKVDVLALGMLTCIADAFRLLEDHYDRPLNLATIPPEDSRVYDMFCRADTIGVFQIESRAQMSMLPRLKPRAFYDLIIEVAIVRPGPIQGDMVHPYLRRREGREPVSFPSKELADVLGKTLGVPLFQEQAMRIAIVAAGFTPSEADRLRRAMATFRKVGIIHEFGLRLVDGMVANGYERAFAERCFKQIEGFGEYGFPESHAASFALLVYVSGWLKRHYPDVFLAAILNAQPMGFYAPAQLVRDARDHGVEVRAPDVNHSDWGATLEARTAPRDLTEEGGNRMAVRLGLSRVKGLSELDAARVVAARYAGGPFESVADVARRARLRPQPMQALADADAFASLGASRRAAQWAAGGVVGPPLPLFEAAGEGLSDDARLPAMGLSEEVVHDYAATGLSLKAHPMRFLRPALDAAGAMDCGGLVEARDGLRVTVAGLVLVRQRPGSAKGVIFISLEDETGVANLIVWPKVFVRFRPVVLGARALRAHGRLQREGRVAHVVVDALEDLSADLADLAQSDVDVGEPFARADEVKRPNEDPRLGMAGKRDMAARRAAAIVPKSRDFH